MRLFSFLFLAAVVGAGAATHGWQPGEASARGARYRLAAGGNFACAVPYDGTVRCWGANSNGQLGNGSTTPSFDTATLVRVATGVTPRVLTGAVEVVADVNDFACALTADGKVFCWGKRTNGQLGDGGNTSEAQTLAKPVTAVTGAVHISAGVNGACALLADGTAKCWGVEFLALNAPPTVIPGLTGVTDLANGGISFGCFLRVGGGAACAGGNSVGELGNGTNTTSNTPVAVVNLGEAVDIESANAATCAAGPQGRVRCWGRNLFGELGTGDFVNQNAPVQVQQINNAVTVDGGAQHFCALTATGTVKCWGNNSNAQLGTGSAVPSLVNVPVDVANLDNVIAVSAGGDSTCAMKADGSVVCWGRGFGETPAAIGNVSGGVNAKSIATGTHSCAVRSSGTVACWGDNGTDAAILGNGSGPALVPNPTAVAGLTNVSAVTVGTEHSCVLLANGNVKCWGRNGRGQIGNSTAVDQPLPADVPNVHDVVAIYAGAFHTCAIQVDGNTFCWGANESGQLAVQADTGDRRQPNLILVPNIVSLGAGRAHNCAVKADGSVFCWGAGAFGQMGNNTTTALNTVAQQVPGITNALSVNAGGDHSCLLDAAGQLRCWGRNGGGQIGNGSSGTDVPAPVAVTTGLTAAAVMTAGGSAHTCAALADGSAACWGANILGQLGLGHNRPQTTPSTVSGLPLIHTIAAGISTSCAVATNGGPFCWGRNTEGQVGDGTTGTLRNAPVAVPSFTLNIVPSALLSPSNPRKVTVNLLAACEEGAKLQARVLVSQPSGAAGHGNLNAQCTGAMSTFPVEVTAQVASSFAPGQAKAEAEAEIQDERGAGRTAQEWTRAITIVSN